MGNQDPSPNGAASPGSTTGPIELMWENWLEANRAILDINENNVLAVKYCFYCAAVQVYNALVQSMHVDLTLKTTSVLSEAMRLDLNHYFDAEVPSSGPTH